MQLILGLISFEMEETKSLWFIIQKFQFLLVFVPLEFYNTIIQKILLFFLKVLHVFSLRCKKALVIFRCDMIFQINCCTIQKKAVHLQPIL